MFKFPNINSSSLLAILCVLSSTTGLYSVKEESEKTNKAIVPSKPIFSQPVTVLEYESSQDYNKKSNETWTQNLIRQKLLYLSKVQHLNTEHSQSLFNVKSEIDKCAALEPGSKTALDTYFIFNQKLDLLASHYGLGWPTPQKPFDGRPQEKSSLTDSIKYIKTSTGYSMKVILSDPRDESSIYAISKKGSGTIEKSVSRLVSDLNLDGYVGGGISLNGEGTQHQIGYYERFIKLYPFERAALSAN